MVTDSLACLSPLRTKKCQYSEIHSLRRLTVRLVCRKEETSLMGEITKALRLRRERQEQSRRVLLPSRTGLAVITAYSDAEVRGKHYVFLRESPSPQPFWISQVEEKRG